MADPLPPHPGIRTDPRVLAAYSEGAGIYRIVPAGVALPGSTDELLSLVRWAAATGTPLVPRGAGSGIPGGAVGAGVILDLRERMPRRLELDPATSSAITSANVTHAELNAAAAPHGLRLPPDPSSSGWATLGGMVSTNAAGARTVRYGPARRWVLGLELVTGDGEVGWLARGEDATRSDHPLQAVTRFRGEVAPGLRQRADLIAGRFPRTRKNTAGYALDQWLASGDDLDLLVGAEGTLGLVTTIRWRLDRIPPARSGLRVALDALDRLEPAVRALAALDPSAVELLDRTFLDLLALAGRSGTRPDLPPGTEAVLLVEFERETPAAAAGAARDAVEALAGLASEVETALSPEQERRLWALRHAASPILASLPRDRRSLQVIEDGCVPLPHLGEYARAIREAATDCGITVVIFGHAGDGHLHVNALPELARPDWLERVERLYRAASAAAIRLGGTVSGEHGDGRLRAPLLEQLYGPELLGLFRRVKAAFDPRGIFNPGVKLGGASPIRQLKVGADAASIDEDIALGLQDIERTGGYARSRLALAESGSGTATPAR